MHHACKPVQTRSFTPLLGGFAASTRFFLIGSYLSGVMTVDPIIDLPCHEKIVSRENNDFDLPA